MKKVLLCLLLLLGLSFCFGCEKSSTGGKVKVVLADADGMKVLGENPVSVGMGERTVFSVELPEGYTVECLTPGVEYNASTHKVTLSDVTYPTTIKVNVKKREMFSFSIVSELSRTAAARFLPTAGTRSRGETRLKFQQPRKKGTSLSATAWENLCGTAECIFHPQLTRRTQ